MLKNSKSSKNLDLRMIKFALSLARRAYGDVSPNPPVGAVLCYNNKPLSYAYHKRAGELHAERLVINNYLTKSQNKKIPDNCTLYVTLEPCSHFGRTPPCTDIILEHGIKKVVYGTPDPGDKSSGGREILEKNGVQVVLSDYSKECSNFLEPWRRYLLKKTKSINIYLILSLNGLMLRVDDFSDLLNYSSHNSQLVDKAKSLSLKVLKKNTQNMICSINEIDKFSSYHLGIFPQSLEDLSDLLLSDIFYSLTVVRVPIFATKDKNWTLWDGAASLEPYVVRQFGDLFIEYYKNTSI